MVKPAIPWPSFDDLPLDKDGPKYNAWGLWGRDDQIGMLNLLTPEVVLNAAQTQIKTGQRVSLNWSMFEPHKPAYGRKTFVQNVIRKPGRNAHDDEWFFNSQGSSQWDSFRHYAYQQTGQYYNGVTNEQIASSNINGIHEFSKEGIVGRGILIDYYGYAQAHDIKLEIFAKTVITVADLIKTLEWQGMSEADILEGDILFIRSGFVPAYEALTEEERDWMEPRWVGANGHQIGMDCSEEALRWFWSKKFSALAGDTRAFEAGAFIAAEKETYHIHPVCLSGWGLTLGEMFDLEALSKKCAELKRYTFFLTSEVLNVPGGVGSPPNALAIF
ncbi:hypothetical protein M231_05386 [Tremella mesenterica]|uniref:Cyclase n=1 Tax=Tremella mesenterica TaxID=5217 RepID=A0A4Q1BI74_TREME|nr:uncharacterized protein TREMEDRAFT_67514 [Tremella mesenterica DSM 1558]EIW70955.1 hypothetical protein TREMEDRAFT_67514 [Tremella mesenterica DSM 1558]RXK37320.1 hypothetical protein M231_05386 [Tremella mesenterica]